jgi:hypothetical protein
MSTGPLDVYLNDHLAGATMGADLARHLASQGEGTPLGDRMTALADEIEADRQTLADLMERRGTTVNPVKQGVTWLAEKAGRLKFSGAGSGDGAVGTFMALEALSLGVEGKRSLWQALLAVRDREPGPAGLDLPGLIRRAEDQRAAIEAERLERAPSALAEGPAT